MKSSFRERDLLKAWAASGLFSAGAFVLSIELGAVVGNVVEEGFRVSDKLAAISCDAVALSVGLGISYLCLREFVSRFLGIPHSPAPRGLTTQ